MDPCTLVEVNFPNEVLGTSLQCMEFRAASSAMKGSI